MHPSHAPAITDLLHNDPDPTETQEWVESVQAVIARDGALTSALISMKSGKKGWDDAVLGAVASAAPFDPLPAGFQPRSVEVHFHVSAVP